MISKNILQCSRKKLNDNYINNIKSYFSNEFVYFNFIDSEIVDYFQNNPLIGFENIIEKYNSFKSGAHKADLFRYYFLYMNGGFYFDDDVMIYNRIDLFLVNYDLIFVKSKRHENTIFNGIIGCNKNNPIIYEALLDAYYIDNILLLKDYHLLCKNLKYIVKKNISNQKIMYLIEDRVIHFKKFGYDRITNNRIVYFRHFWGSKLIFKINNFIENKIIIFFLLLLYKLVSFLKKFKKESLKLIKHIFKKVKTHFYILKIFKLTKFPIILGGPFKGMKYIKNSSWGPILPKLIGTYEKPIYSWVEKIILNEYSTIINIGSGEGYYAAGFSKFSPNTKVFAFDIDNNAIYFLNKIKSINNLSNLISSSIISNKILNNLIIDNCLIFIDIEGNEHSVLNINNIPNLINCDILIELHVFLIPNITSILTNRFNKTHNINIIFDNNLRTIDNNVYIDISENNLKFLVDENRPASMSWMFLTTKSKK